MYEDSLKQLNMCTVACLNDSHLPSDTHTFHCACQSAWDQKELLLLFFFFFVIVVFPHYFSLTALLGGRSPPFFCCPVIYLLIHHAAILCGPEWSSGRWVEVPGWRVEDTQWREKCSARSRSRRVRVLRRWGFRITCRKGEGKSWELLFNRGQTTSALCLLIERVSDRFF